VHLSELVNVSFILYVLAKAYSFLTIHLVKWQGMYGISLGMYGLIMSKR